MLCSLGSVKHSIVATHTPHAAHPGAIFLRINHAVFVVACKVTAKDPHLLRVPLDPEIAFFSKRGVPTVANQPVVDLRDWISICADDGHSVVDVVRGAVGDDAARVPFHARRVDADLRWSVLQKRRHHPRHVVRRSVVGAGADTVGADKTPALNRRV